MPVNRIVLLCVVGGGLTVFVLSNLSAPVLPLVFLGMQTTALPLTLWIGFAIALGVFTSFVLQLLSSLPRRGPRSNSVSPESPDEYQESETEFEQEELEAEEPQTDSTPPESAYSASGSDWEERVAPDWDFDGTSTASSTDDEFEWDEYESEPEQESSEPIERDRPDEDVTQEPRRPDPNNSVYSYSYRESKKSQSGIGKTDAVYDANYRVITPPYRQPSPPEDYLDEDEDEEDWGFDFEQK